MRNNKHFVSNLQVKLFFSYFNYLGFYFFANNLLIWLSLGKNAYDILSGRTIFID